MPRKKKQIKRNIYGETRRIIQPKTKNQESLVESIENNQITFCDGPAGCGKSLLITYYAVKYLFERKVDRIIITRPLREAGERLGYLPGTFEDKINPYLHPIFDYLSLILNKKQITDLFEDGKIEAFPLALMRGASFHKCFVILDEAQNTNMNQMKMFLTRIGDNTKMVINGDITQNDLYNEKSGLEECWVLKDIDEVGFVHMTYDDILRNKIIKDILYEFSKNGL